MSSSPIYSHIQGSHAIVIGGGMAGLLAAHILTNHFERVSLIERDQYPTEPVFRPGTPQGHHVHTMLVRGQQILEELFPGIKNKLLMHGAVDSDFTADYRYHLPSGWMRPTPSRLKGYACTRHLLEWQVRQEVLARERVNIIEQHEVVNLLASSDKRTVTGVQMRARNSTAPAERESVDLAADLVVDTSGRDSQVSRWLKALGYMPPPETVINPFFGYASRLYTLAPDSSRTWKGIGIQTDPPKNLRGGVIWPTEGGKWFVVLAGTGKDFPPTDEDGFLEFSKSLSDPIFYATLKAAQPCSKIYGYRRTENRLRHFERLTQLPEGFVALGDSVCAFNPVYGQGMTMAALGALVLDKSLHQQGQRGLVGLPRRFQRKLASINKTTWQLATASDYRVPGTEGLHLSWIDQLMYRYIDNLVAVLPTEPLVSQMFSEVLHLVTPPTALFRPTIVAKIIKHRLARNKSTQISGSTFIQ